MRPGLFSAGSIGLWHGVQYCVFTSVLYASRSVLGRLHGPVARSAVLRAEEAERGAVLPELAAGKGFSHRCQQIPNRASEIQPNPLMSFIFVLGDQK